MAAAEGSIDRKTLFTGSFFLLLAFTLYQAGRLLWPSSGALLGAAVLAVVFHPVHDWRGRHLASRTLRALLAALFVLIFFFVPLGWLVWAALRQADTLIPIIHPAAESLMGWVQSAPHEFFSGLADRFPGLADQLRGPSAALQNYLGGMGDRSLAWLARFGAQAAQGLWLVSLAIVALFFFFR